MTGVIILAAGSSSRLGKPKQNLVFQGQTLLQRAIRNALNSICGKVIVVLGANADVILPTIQDQPITIIQNPDWAEGMSSSIRLGIHELQKDRDITSAILMLCDQPFADTSILNSLVQKSKATEIVACIYDGTTGPPALFSHKYFDELAKITGSEGAKKLLIRYSDEVTTAPFLLGRIDIDTISDFERLEKGI